MTDRVRHLTITLETDIRADDLAPIVSALQHVRGVAIVEPHVVQVPEHLARQAVRAELELKLHEAIESVFRQHALREKLKER
jgi:hypothetical protein